MWSPGNSSSWVVDEVREELKEEEISLTLGFFKISKAKGCQKQFTQPLTFARGHKFKYPRTGGQGTKQEVGEACWKQTASAGLGETLFPVSPSDRLEPLRGIFRCLERKQTAERFTAIPLGSQSNGQLFPVSGAVPLSCKRQRSVSPAGLGSRLPAHHFTSLFFPQPFGRGIPERQSSTG